MTTPPSRPDEEIEPERNPLSSSKERRELDAEQIRQDFVKSSQKLPDPATRKKPVSNESSQDNAEAS